MWLQYFFILVKIKFELTVCWSKVSYISMFNVKLSDLQLTNSLVVFYILNGFGDVWLQVSGFGDVSIQVSGFGDARLQVSGLMM